VGVTRGFLNNALNSNTASTREQGRQWDRVGLGWVSGAGQAFPGHSSSGLQYWFWGGCVAGWIEWQPTADSLPERLAACSRPAGGPRVSSLTTETLSSAVSPRSALCVGLKRLHAPEGTPLSLKITASTCHCIPGDYTSLPVFSSERQFIKWLMTDDVIFCAWMRNSHDYIHEAELSPCSDARPAFGVWKIWLLRYAKLRPSCLW
jgi:hypothetical protein